MDDGRFVGCLFLDLQKAFDCVDHKVLLLKLSKMNVNPNELMYFESYLTNRNQKVRVNNVFSESKVIIKGVPQGSILGPLLFKLYINDLTNIKLKGTIQLYADDAVVKYANNDENELRNDIESDLNSIEQWLTKHKLLLNVKKTKILLFENRNFSDINFYMKGIKIEVVRSFNYLGLILDSKMKWNAHVEQLIKKITPYVFIIKRLRRYFTKDVLKKIYSSYIISNIIYLNPIWNKASMTLLNKIDIVHKKVIKTIYNYPLLYPTSNLYNNQYISFMNICKIEMYLIAFKITNDEIKHNFLINRMIDIHNYNTRNRTNFYLALFKTRNQQNNCLYNCLKLYNELPNELKLIKNLYSFKKKIKEHVLLQ